MKEVYLYKKLADGSLQCQTCAHYCRIEPGKTGLCGARKNIGGRLFALNYGKAVALNIDPIEKKPFSHFLPRTYSLSIAAAGCNFRCLNCQNWDISQYFREKNNTNVPGEDLSPERVIEIALQEKLPSISYTYTEPTIFFEYALDIMQLAKKTGKLKNAFVSNGFMSVEAANLAIPYLDAANIDIKSFSNKFYKEICGGKLQPVLDTAKLLKKKGVWLEITTLLIPGLNDSAEEIRAVANFIKKELGTETPWHISPFISAISWKLRDLPNTSEETLKMGYEIGKKIGLKNVYL